eukprot:CAMPEP_0181107734 /NCGR_PEP_ID=MMETSP1071-20121207/17243_1 /TAXON_ID=35127 /ORGANISM="Thalassiosira sp., Strain NH16" /LENGTH=303 /DNA_ID=CAMNT_0023191267 /DNA_START=1721 /DNA_END=2632 /DNA_ORIENTATION=+
MVIRALFLHLILVGAAARSSNHNGHSRPLRNAKAKKELERHLKDSRLLQYDFKRVLVDRGIDQSRSLVSRGRGNAYGHDNENSDDSDSVSEDDDVLLTPLWDSASLTSDLSSESSGDKTVGPSATASTSSSNDGARRVFGGSSLSSADQSISLDSSNDIETSASSLDVDSTSSGDESVLSVSSGDRRRKLERRLPGKSGKGHAYGGHGKDNVGKSGSEDDAASIPTTARTKGDEMRLELGRRLPGKHGKGHHAYGKVKGKAHAYGHDKNNVGKSSSEDATSRPTFALNKSVSPPPGQTDDWLV